MDEKQLREKAITKTSVVGILANVFLVAFKALAGLLSGSIAIILDAVNNLTDAISSIVTIIGVKLAKKKPDDDHPFGHGRVEYFSAIIVAGIVLATGITSLIESIKKIITPEAPEYTGLTLAIIIVAIVTKFVLGRYVKSQGEKFNSEALIASGADASFDSIISVGTLVCAGVMMLFQINLDGIVGAIISCFIIKAGLEMLGESVGSVMGTRPDSEVTKGIKALIKTIPGVNGAFDLILHDYGPSFAIGSVHVEVDDTMTANELHKLTKIIQKTVMDEYSVMLTVGFYSHNTNNDKHREMEDEIRSLILTKEGALGMHAFFVDEEMNLMSFDITIDFKVKNHEDFKNDVIEGINKMYPGFNIEINLDANYSD